MTANGRWDLTRRLKGYCNMFNEVTVVIATVCVENEYLNSSVEKCG